MTDLTGAKNLSENLRKLVQSHQFSYIENEITLSFGVAELEFNDTKKTLFEKADSALYEAKKNGRNQTQICTQPIGG